MKGEKIMMYLKNLSIFGNSSVKLTKKDKAMYAVIAAMSIVLTGAVFYCIPAALAEITPGDIDNLIDKIIKILCTIAGALFVIVGGISFAIAHSNEDGPAKQKAILQIATGAVLVALGQALPLITTPSWFEAK